MSAAHSILRAVFPGRLALCAAASACGLAVSGATAAMELPFDKYTLENGMTVILHEDHALPLVAVNIMVRVGSRFEEPKRTGFAHLFEHLMFMGTRRVPTKMFDAWMEAEGAWNNAWTSEDRTDYFDVGPSHTLPLLLWLEADRFQSLGRDMTPEKLDAQRDVVRNERRQTSENTPYGKVELRLPELLFPEDHPYHHPVIGSHEDLQAASVDDVKAFFARFYAPHNMSLVVAGDLNEPVTKEMIAKLFGPLGEPASKAQALALSGARQVKLGRVIRETMPDDVNLPKVVMAWHSPARFAPGDAEMDLVASILQEGKASRLYKALVYDNPLAQEVSASQVSGDLGSTFTVEAIARPDVKLDVLEKAIDAELARIAAVAILPAELDRAKNQLETAFVSRLQSVARRAQILNTYETYRGDPGYAQQDLARYRAATPQSVQASARAVLDLGSRVILRVVPRAPDGGGASSPPGGTK